MLEICTGYTMFGIPYLSYDALDQYGERLVQDFAPELLESPGALDIDSFLEFYLGLTVEYRHLSYDRSVLGLTAFNNGFVDVIDGDTDTPQPIFVRYGTVLVDEFLLTRRNIPRLRFTLAHEGAHWLLHRRAFSTKPQNESFLAAKKGRYDYRRTQKERDDNERMERQADFLAASVLMPLPAVRIAFREYFRLCEDAPSQIVRNRSPRDNFHAIQLPSYIAKTFNVSKQAALIRLEKLEAIVNSEWNRSRGIHI